MRPMFAAALFALGVVVAALLSGSGRGAGETLTASVGPGFTISLTSGGSPVTTLAPGTYTIDVDDQSASHDFHLTGPGVDRSTAVEFVGSTTWTVDLQPGSYHFQCDPHFTTMNGDFTVIAPSATTTAPSPPPAPPTTTAATTGATTPAATTSPTTTTPATTTAATTTTASTTTSETQPAPAPTTTTAATPQPVTTAATAPRTASPRLAARVLRVRATGRLVRVAVAVNTTAVVDARLMRRGRVLAHGRARGRGTVVVALRLQRSLPRGAYVVRAAVTAGGRTTTVAASLRVP